MEKGIFIIADKSDGAAYLWKNTKFFSEDEIKAQEHKDEIFLPIFNEAWMALQYIKANNLEGSAVCGISGPEAWDYYLGMAKKTGAEKAVLNRCILNTAHECTLMTYLLDEIKDFKKADQIMKSSDYISEGYDKQKLLNT